MNRNGVPGWSGGLLTAALMAACGGSTVTGGSSVPIGRPSSASTSSATASAGSGSTVAACSLVTEQEATAFLGSDPGPGMETSNGSSPSCGYGASLTVVWDNTGGRQAFDIDRTGYRGYPDFQDVSGVGDAAFVVSVAGGSTGALGILKDSNAILISIQAFQPGNVTAAKLTAMGMTVVGRI